MLGDQKWIHSLHVLLKLLHVPLELRPPVLEPRDHLGIAQTQLSGNLVPVGWAQVLLIQESLLQLEDLLIRERGPALTLLLRLLAIVEQVQVIGLLLTVFARIEGFAGHLEECVQGTALPCGSLAVLASVGAMLLRHFSLELLLLRLLERWMMQAGMNARVMKRSMMMVMMGERVRATGIRHGAPSGRRGTAEGRLADGTGHGRE